MKLVVETLLHRHLDQSAAIGVKHRKLINMTRHSLCVCFRFGTARCVGGKIRVKVCRRSGLSVASSLT